MRIRAAIACLLMQVLPSLCAAEGGRHDGAYLRDVSMSFQTQHLTWAERFPNGAINVIGITPRGVGARDFVEISQRFDIAATVVTIHRPNSVAIEDPYESAIQGTSPQEKERELLTKLDAKKYDAIVLANCDFSNLPLEARYRILRAVSDGTGLLIVHPAPLFPYPRVLGDPIQGASDILCGVPDPGSLGGGGALSVGCYRFGRGRIAVLSFPVGMQGWDGEYAGITAGVRFSPTWHAQYERSLVQAARAIFWASGRVRGSVVRTRPLGGEVVSEGREIRLAISLRESGVRAVQYRIRDAWNSVLAKGDIPIVDRDGDVFSSLPVPALSPGRYFFDYIIESVNGVEDFGMDDFSVPSPIGSLALHLDRDSVERGQDVQVSARLERALSNPALVEASFLDSPYGRVWAKVRRELDAGNSTFSLSMSTDSIPTAVGRIVIRVMANDRVVGIGDANVILRDRSRPLFLSFVWDSADGPLAAFYAQRIVGDLSWKFALAHPSREKVDTAALLNQHIIPYVMRPLLLPGRDPGCAGWVRQGNWKSFLPGDMLPRVAELRGDESIYNPQARELWKAAAVRHLDYLPKYGPLVYSLGDECDFSYDIGYSPSEDAAYRKFLSAKYGQVDRLNAEWGTSYDSFAAVEHAKPQQLMKNRCFPAWFDHCAFVERQYADTFSALAGWIRERDPHALVGAEGSVPGDLEKTIENLDFWGPYSDPIMDEVLRSLDKKNRIRSLWWGGYVGSHGGRSEQPVYLWRRLLSGVINANSFFRSKIASEGFLGSDFTYASYFSGLLPHLRRLERGLAQLLVVSPLTRHGVAIRWDHMSSRASLFDRRLISPGDTVMFVQDYCGRNGINFDHVSSGDIRSGALKGYRALFVCGGSVMDESEECEIMEFAKNGGIVVADFPLAQLNGFGRPVVGLRRISDLFPMVSMERLPEPFFSSVNASASIRGRNLELKARKTRTVPGAPCLSFQEYGKGIGCLLNFSLGSARGTEERSGATEEILGELMHLAGIDSGIGVAVNGRKDVMVKMRDFPGGNILGVLLDGKNVDMEVRMPRKRFVYVCDSGFLGVADHFSYRSGDSMTLFFLSDKEEVSPGFTVSALSAGSGAFSFASSDLDPGRTYRFEVIGSDGSSLPGPVVFQARAGVNASVFRIPLDERTKNYRCTLTDIATGLSSVVDTVAGDR